MKKITFALAGSSTHTLLASQELFNNPLFTCQWILTPQAKVIGRKQILTANPVDLFAKAQKLPTIYVDHKITEENQAQIEKLPSIDFLLVVDFGYIIPDWLLKIPKRVALNIHPSALPQFRGSSPGQYTLLYGYQTGTVCLIKMEKSLDSGAIYYKLNFPIKKTATSADYYEKSFQLIAKELPNLLRQIYQDKLEAQIQPDITNLIIAKKINKEDAYLDFQLLLKLIGLKNTDKWDTQKPTLLNQILLANDHKNWPQVIERACRAFNPWPRIWTYLPTHKGKKRMQILNCSIQGQRLILDLVQVEGLEKSKFNQIKNIIKI